MIVYPIKLPIVHKIANQFINHLKIITYVDSHVRKFGQKILVIKILDNLRGDC